MTRVVLSFDDGRKDNIEVAYNILQHYNIKATFNIATAYVDGTIPPQLAPCLNPAMDISDVKTLSESGYEIAAHGDNHINEMPDIKRGIMKLQAWINQENNVQLGFASPRSNLSKKEIIKEADIIKSMGIPYVRIGVHEGYNIVKRVERKIAEITKSKILFYCTFRSSLNDINHELYPIFYSVPVMHKTTVSQLEYLVKKAAEEQLDCILMFHSIVGVDSEFYDDEWSWDKERFNKLCEMLVHKQSNHEIQVCTNFELIQ